MRLASLLLIALLAASFLPVSPIAPLELRTAQAQQRDRPNLLELLFGGALRRQQVTKPRQQEPARTRRVIVNRRSSNDGGSQPAPKEVIQKAEDAATVLVVGDFMADGLRWGLEQAYSANPSVKFVDRASGLSGLVRDDVRDWPASLGGYIDETKPVAVIVFIGMNDRQEIRIGGGLEKLGKAWREEYEARIDRMIAAVAERRLPLIWMGLPAVRSSRMNSDYLVFNEIYRRKVESVGGVFVDIWDGFTNAEGAFISAGPDINGQIVRLRNSDGINMTNAGKRKLAFYAERALRRVIGLDSDAVVAAPQGLSGTKLLEDSEYDPARTGETVVISLDDPQFDGASVLAGGEEEEAGVDVENSTSHRLVAEGIVQPAHSGRIDAGWGAPDDMPQPEEAEKDDEPEEEPTPLAVPRIPSTVLQ